MTCRVLEEELRKTEQPGSGLVRSLVMQDQKDTSRAYMLVVFESEEKAREGKRSTASGGLAGGQSRDGGDLRRRSRVRRPYRR